ncbi:MAG: hypothetical protein ACRDAM_13440 [Casimicrobium sp.]
MRFSNQVKRSVAAVAIVAASMPVLAQVTATCNGVTVTDPKAASCSCVNGKCTTSTGTSTPTCFTFFGLKFCF